MLILILSAFAGAVVVAAVTAAGLLGWAGQLPLVQRGGLTAMAGGLLWGGIDRALGRPVGLGDLIFLLGLATYVVATHIAAFRARVKVVDDIADEVEDLGRRFGPRPARWPPRQV